jgi:tetratricopeptide (TPR) repeat protein
MAYSPRTAVLQWDNTSAVQEGAMSQLRVFVSHSSSDKAFADALVRALRQAGADVWYDEHNLGAGQLLDDIQKELRARPAFIVVLSKAAFASVWVQRECKWAFNLYSREPQRILLPVVAQAVEPTDFNAMLYLEDFRRVEGPGNRPYPQAEAIDRTLRLLALTPAGATPTPTTPQPAESVEDLIAHGKALMAKNQYARAIPFFERATGLAPRSFDALAKLGWAYTMAGRHDDGIVAYDRALALDPNQAWIWTNKGNVLNGLKRYDEALVALDRALALDPNRAAAWYYETRRIDVSGRKRNLDPNLAVTWYNEGNALRGLKRYEEAVAAYGRAVALDPKHGLAWQNKAYSLRALGREAEAQEAERRAKELGG